MCDSELNSPVIRVHVLWLSNPQLFIIFTTVNWRCWYWLTACTCGQFITMELAAVSSPKAESEKMASGYGTLTSENDAAPVGNSGRLLGSGRSTPVSNGRGGGESSDGYEELLKDSVPCPTCRGLGRVPSDQVGELVALIPMKDKRLKPRRTVLYVAIAIALCVLTAGLLMFFLFPRDVVVSSDRPLLQPVLLNLNVSASFVNFTVVNYYNFTNSNFVPVQIVGAQMTAMYDERMMAKATNSTSVEVPIRSSLNYGIGMTFVLSRENDFGFLVSFCEDRRPWVHNLPITFELLANYTYLGHVEQATLTTFQQVSCYNNSAYTSDTL